MNRNSISSALFYSCFLLFLAPKVNSDITLDGSLGGSAGALSGPDFLIPAELGVQQGSNLFHSFAAFNVLFGESATFSGPGSVANILSRVTGGAGSTIDGILRSTIPGADLYFVNPAGIVFGANAQLDVQGAFHASTADYVRLGDDGRFSATTDAQQTVLSSAPPAAFGFLDGDPSAQISVNGSVLQVPGGEVLSLSGGDVVISGGTLVAPRGQINIAAVAVGELPTSGQDHTGSLGPDPIEIPGDVTLSSGADLVVTGQGEGIFIRGGMFTVEGASQVRTLTDSTTVGKGAPISVEVEEMRLTEASGIRSFSSTGSVAEGGDIEVSVAGSIEISGSEVSSQTSGPGDAGDIRLDAGESVLLSEGAVVASPTLADGDGGEIVIAARNLQIDSPGETVTSGIFTSTFGVGDSGSLDIAVERELAIQGEGGIFTSTVGNGDAGAISIDTGSLKLSESGVIDSSSIIFAGQGGDIIVVARESITLAPGIAGKIPSGITSLTNGQGRSGALRIETPVLLMQDNSQINASTQSSFESGEAGNIDLEVGQLTLNGNARVANVSSGIAPAGNIHLKAGQVALNGGAQISSSAFGAGPGGDLSMQVSDDILISGRVDSQIRSGIFSVSNDLGRGGNLSIDAGGTLRMDDGRILTRTLGGADAGVLEIRAANLVMSNGAQIFAGIGNALAAGGVQGFMEGSGNGGDMMLTIADSVSISGRDVDGFQSGLFSSAQIGRGNAGDIHLSAKRLTVSDGAAISVSSSRIAQGNGGSIELDVAGMAQLTGGAEITASTFGPGRGGNVVIDATRVELSDGSSMLASSVSENPDAGISGSIVITTKDRLTLDRQSKVTVETERADAGEIIVQAKQLVLLDRQSEISTSVAGGEGDGGNIRIDPVFVVLNDSSGIIANAQRGMGGNIDIRITKGGAFLQSPDSIVDASSEFGLDGRVDIVAPDTDVSGGISTLPASFLNAANLLADRCAARNTEEVSSFVVLGEDRVPLAPRYSSLSTYAVGAKRRAGLVLAPNTGSRNYRLDYGIHCRQHHAH